MTDAIAGEAEIAHLERLFSAPELASTQFSRSFLAAVPAGEVSRIVEQMVGSLGTPRAIVQDGDDYAIETDTHSIPTKMTLDSNGLIDGLLFQPPVALTASLEETLEKLSGLADTVSYLVETSGAARLERESSRPLAVGSAFKLGVLKVLADDIAAGRSRWDDVVRLAESDRSLPSGDLRLYPAGSPFTLHTLAAEMIARSDNTATDLLIRVVGAERAADVLGLDTLLTTRALFQLKAEKALANAYVSGSADDRKAILKQLSDRDLPSVAAASSPYAPGLEWMIPVERLCSLAVALSDLDVFQINPGPVRPGLWQRVAYKGGSETGVLNLTAALTGKDGRTHCLSVTLNGDKPIDEASAAGLFSRATAQLATGK
ncbi:serine hydrolase [Pleomorphomonas sp. JP5]|uniref:serine hydrolase n=1 Tax=Pleomorphomonas sp. JP5 TaxID=2942998 RepID=UPI00204378AA|nr:serine hydrolase [Pleomorphomonas sp. JP5]MCM5560115.1 class A beta-lactamase-related serine hydrolase [Pleomorphomonas sp. JP5]